MNKMGLSEVLDFWVLGKPKDVENQQDEFYSKLS